MIQIIVLHVALALKRLIVPVITSGSLMLSRFDHSRDRYIVVLDRFDHSRERYVVVFIVDYVHIIKI